VKMLLEWKGVSPDKPDNRGRTLMVAASRYYEVIELLQSHRAATRGAVWNPGAPPETATGNRHHSPPRSILLIEAILGHHPLWAEEIP